MARLSGREIAKLKILQNRIKTKSKGNDPTIVKVICEDSHIESLTIKFHSSKIKENEKITKLIVPLMGIPTQYFKIVKD